MSRYRKTSISQSSQQIKYTPYNQEHTEKASYVTELEQLFDYISEIIKSYELALPWNVFIHMDNVGLSSTLIQLLNMLVDAKTFIFRKGIINMLCPEGESLKCISFLQYFKGIEDIKCKITIIKGKLDSSLIDSMYITLKEKQFNGIVYSVLIRNYPIVRDIDILSDTINIPAMLTREGIFPRTSIDNKNIPLYKISFTSESIYSSTPLIYNQHMISDIVQHLHKYKLKEFVILDGTAHTGSDVINTVINGLKYFKKSVIVIAVEIDKINYDALVHNIQLFNINNYVYPVLGDTLTVLENSGDLPRIPNIIYLDPPWGGITYKDKKIIDLSLGGLNVFRILLNLAENIEQYKILSLIVLKAPRNINQTMLKEMFGDSYIIRSYNVIEGSNIIYIYIDVYAYRIANKKMLSIDTSFRLDIKDDEYLDETMSIHEYLSRMGTDLSEPMSPSFPMLRYSDGRIEHYDSYYIYQPFYSLYNSWVHLTFTPEIFPVLNIGILPTQAINTKRFYLFPRDNKETTYLQAVKMLYRFMWLNRYQGDILYMSGNVLSKEVTSHGVSVIILDINITNNYLEEFLNALLIAKMGVVDHFYDLFTPYISFKTTIYKLYYMTAYNPKNNVNYEIGIASIFPLPIVTLSFNNISLDIPSDKSVLSYLRNLPVKIDLLSPKRIGKFLKGYALKKPIIIETNIIETELLRKKLYEDIVVKIYNLKLTTEKDGKLKQKEVNNIVLRYLFNKIITRRDDDDPIFITDYSILADKQLIADLEYHKIINYDYKQLPVILNAEFIKAKQILTSSDINIDQPVTYEDTTNKYIYKNIKYEDISNLMRNYKNYTTQAIALNIRYNYIKLSTQGLANNYEAMGYKPSDNILEAFASSFNHYFNRYHSAFPDLEKYFGSLGSFFKREIFNEDIVMVNPPFDLTVMITTINKILLYLRGSKDKKQLFILTFPEWSDVKEFNDLKTSIYTKEWKMIPKHKTNFINHMDKGKIIHPCNILEFVLKVN
jgi:hypothetical protein